MAIEQFNDATSNVNVLLMNTMVGSAGLNLHHSCNFGIQVQMPWSFGSTGQYIGRLIRIGQTKRVTFAILSVNDSVYNYLEYKACLKEVRALMATLNYPGWLERSKIARKLIAYNVLRVTWSQPFHRMAWEAIHMQEIQDFNSEAMRQAAGFYQLLSELLLQTDEPPSDHEDILELINNDIVVLALVWADMCKGNNFSNYLDWKRLRTMLQVSQNDTGYREKAAASQPDTEFGTVKKRNKTVLQMGDSDPKPKRGRKRGAEESEDEASPSKGRGRKRRFKSSPVARESHTPSEDDDGYMAQDRDELTARVASAGQGRTESPLDSEDEPLA